MSAYVTRPYLGTGGGAAWFVVEVGSLLASLGMLLDVGLSPTEADVSPTEADVPPTEAGVSPTEADVRFDRVWLASLFNFLFWARAC
jgi:hypothetical protein